MTTTSKPKKRTTKTPAKRSITKKEYDAITNSYYRLKGMVYKMVESGKYNEEAEKQLPPHVHFAYDGLVIQL